MIIKSSRSRFVSVLSIILFLVFTVSTSYPGSTSSQESDAKRFYNDGIRSFENGEYNNAIDWFMKTLELTQDKQLQTETYVYLSLVNFYLGDSYNSQNWLKKALDNDPGKEVPSRFPSDYIDLFNKTKSEYAKEVAGKQRETEEAKVDETEKREPRTVAVKAGKKEGSKKTLLLVLGGALVAGGIVLLLLKPWKGDTGSIQVNSTPQGAKIFLDGTDTMKVTNNTLDSVSAGSHIVRISLDDYEDYEETVTVTAGETAIVNVQLTKHTIEVTSPTANDTWQLGGDVTITWTTSGSSGTSIASRMNRGIEHIHHQVVRLSRMRNIRSRPGAREISGQSRETRNCILSRGSERRAVSPSLSNGTANERSSQNTLSALKNPRNESIDKLNVSTFHQKYRSLDENQLLTVRNVKIELHQTGFGWRYTIADNTSNTGSFSWSVPTSLEAGSGYFVRISSVSDPSVTGDSEQFSIVSNATTNNK